MAGNIRGASSGCFGGDVVGERSDKRVDTWTLSGAIGSGQRRVYCIASPFDMRGQATCQGLPAASQAAAQLHATGKGQGGAAVAALLCPIHNIKTLAQRGDG